MSVGALSLAGSLFTPARSTGGSSRVEEANRQVQLDQQKVDDRKAEADRKARAAAQAATELKEAKAEIAKDQAELNTAKTKARLDVYT